ncbi:dual specificity protein phosphatase CDC14C isoform X2 [Dendroctonus ponderosae]|uniref:protein-tyrosine-phosphatase n=1 Tax=Dendroctonus ponderosae TaxID=77166 RepID=A0AAR5Q960_DENPD|nr:dual specificity protein phosphatase CDC14C isoform X2 [Dendroctonus ponderosae]
MERILKNPQSEIESVVEILSNTLYFAVLKSPISRKLQTEGDLFYFSIDDELHYQHYYCDFGPLNISCLYKYCMKLNRYMQFARRIKGIVHYTCSHPDKRTNAAFLMGAYCVLYLKMEPKAALQLIQKSGQLKPFLDASQCFCQFTLKMIDCYQAVAKAQSFNFFNFDDFNVSEYDLYNKLEYGDINWLLPRKFLAFIGPADNRTAHPPEFYIKYFLKNDVKTVIRLNNVLYDSYAFMQVGIQHYDLIFPDGSTPPKEILLKFLYIAESAPTAVGVHCKAGLGRTGCLIGAYLMKHYRMTAREAIAWLRICRPGSVIGQQQVWLEKLQSWLWRIGSQYRLQHYGEGDKIPRHRYGIYSKQWPVEREKAIRDARQSIQTTFTRSQIGTFVQGVDSRIFPSSGDNFKHIAKLLNSVHGFCQTEKEATEKRPTRVEKKLNCTLELAPKKPLITHSGKKLLVKAPYKHAASQGDKLNEIKMLRNQKPKVSKSVKCRHI